MNVQTAVRAGTATCPDQWFSGTVNKATGGGYYGSIRGDDGSLRYFNLSYTKFFPQGQGVSVGERVWYAPNPQAGPRYGKVLCLQPGY